MGNRDAPNIQHIGFRKLSTNLSNFKLNKILHVPQIFVNLLFINQLAHYNDCMVCFDADNVFVQDKPTKKMMYPGYSKGAMYPLSNTVVSNSSLVAFHSGSYVGSVWHNRLGHPASHILNVIFQHLNLPCSKTLVVIHVILLSRIEPLYLRL